MCSDRPADLPGGTAGGGQQGSWLFPFHHLSLGCPGTVTAGPSLISQWACSSSGLHEAEGDGVSGIAGAPLYLCPQQVVGESQLRSTSLKDLGLLGGQAAMRFVFLPPDAQQQEMPPQSAVSGSGQVGRGGGGERGRGGGEGCASEQMEEERVAIHVDKGMMEQTADTPEAVVRLSPSLAPETKLLLEVAEEATPTDPHKQLEPMELGGSCQQQEEEQEKSEQMNGNVSPYLTCC